MAQENQFTPLPDLGDIVYCRFPEAPGAAGPKPRPAFVVGHGEFPDGTPAVEVAYGTSQHTTQLFAGEFAITRQTPIAYRLSGLSFDTKFDLANTLLLPYTDKWFRVPPSRKYGNTPKLGTLHASLFRAAQAAYAAALAKKPK